MLVPLPVITDTFRVALNWTNGSRTAENVMHFRGPGDAAALMGDLDSHVTREMWNATNQDTIWNTASITPLDGSSATSEFPFGGASNANRGIQTGQPIPQSAAIVKLTTALRGRSFRGRLYLPDVAENIQDAGELLDTMVSTWQSAWDDFLADMSGAGFPLVVASYTLASAEDVTSVLCESQTGTQRRRQSRNR